LPPLVLLVAQQLARQTRMGKRLPPPMLREPLPRPWALPARQRRTATQLLSVAVLMPQSLGLQTLARSKQLLLLLLPFETATEPLLAFLVLQKDYLPQLMKSSLGQREQRGSRRPLLLKPKRSLLLPLEVETDSRPQAQPLSSQERLLVQAAADRLRYLARTGLAQGC
jgi:hypothetical protein